MSKTIEELRQELKNKATCVSPSGNHCIHYDLGEDCCFCGKRRIVPAKDNGSNKK